MTWQLLVLLGLATYGISQTVTRYDGVANVFSKFRQGKELFNCPVCLGWWVSLGLTAIAFVVTGADDVLLFGLLWLAANGLSMLLNIWSDQ